LVHLFVERDTGAFTFLTDLENPISAAAYETQNAVEIAVAVLDPDGQPIDLICR
jgi:hypothetical protein